MKPLMYKPGSERAPRRPDTIESYSITPDNPDTLLPALIALMPMRKKTTVKDYMKHRQVKINGTVSTQFDFPLKPGDEILVNISREWQEFSHPRMKIVYEDDYLIVVEKGYGLLSVGTEKVKTETAYSIIKDYLKRKDPRNKVFVVHRLDQHTSGLMMFAKTVQAKETMQHNWNNMVLDRRYAAIVEGRPDTDSGVVESYLAENTEHLMYSADGPDHGKLAVTRWQAVRSRNGYTLMDVSLDTGRKNQIRVHMKDLGHPIAGDRRYGARTSPLHRLALHARTLRFIHPVTREDMNFSIPLPPGFTRLV